MGMTPQPNLIAEPRAPSICWLFSLLISTLLASSSMLSTALAATPSRLSDDFHAASQFDPEFQSAIAQRDAGLETQEQAIASLRPQAYISFQRSINDTFSRSTTALGPIDRRFENYPSLNASIQIRQAVYRPKLWATLDQSRFQAIYAELSLLGAQQDLGLRLLSNHAQWASAALSKQLAEQGLVIQQRMLLNTKQQSLAGELTRVDVELSDARVAQANSQISDASSALAAARFAVMQMTGTAGVDGSPSTLRPVDPIKLPLDLIERLPMALTTLQEWRKAADQTSPVIRAYGIAVEVAAQETRKASADHWPTVDAFASRSQATSAMENTIGTDFRSAAIGVQINVPIYSGGAVNSQIRQTEALLRRAQQDLLSTRAKIANEVEREWHNLEAARALANSQRTLLRALGLSFQAVKRGQNAGVATRMDEDQIGLQIIGAERELALANARALSAWARLMASIGGLSAQSMQQLQLEALSD